MITVRFGPNDDPFESTTTEWEDPDDAAHFAETLRLDESLWVEFDEIAAFAASIEKTVGMHEYTCAACRKTFSYPFPPPEGDVVVLCRRCGDATDSGQTLPEWKDAA